VIAVAAMEEEDADFLAIRAYRDSLGITRFVDHDPHVPFEFEGLDAEHVFGLLEGIAGLGKDSVGDGDNLFTAVGRGRDPKLSARRLHSRSPCQFWLGFTMARTFRKTDAGDWYSLPIISFASAA